MSDDVDSTPFETQKVFGAGLKRKRIDFVPARVVSSSEAAQQTNASSSVSERYLSIVLKNSASPKDSRTTGAGISDTPASPPRQQQTLKDAVCEICKLPLGGQNNAASTSSKPHESSMAHQVCLTHSYPPSHLDRNRQGLKYLSSYGWDPDSRLGLGATGEGIRVPIKVKAKDDTVGLGIVLKGVKATEKKSVSLDAKQTRKTEMEDRKKRERLQEMFYRSEDVERYLGG
ncbi:hypothetical protein P7C71_g6408, partial [Lecanoromycetidae sp. Uapishka_2]